MPAVPARSHSTDASRLGASSGRKSALALEARLVLLSAGPPSQDAAIAALAAQELDWQAVAWVAARERASAALHERLVQALGRAKLPAGAEPLRRLAMIAEFQSHFLEQRLREAMTLLGGHGIAVVLLKGAGLALTAYPRFKDRPMGDVDLLVHEPDAARARRLLAENGWVSRRDIAAERTYEGHQHVAPLEDTAGVGVGLEVHTGLFTDQAPFALEPGLLWREARLVAGVRGGTAHVHPPHLQLLHACLHFAWSHEMMFGAWRTFRDVEMLLASGTLDVDAFLVAARESRGATCCYWTLRLARDLAGVAVPGHALAALRPPLPDTVMRRLVTHFALQLGLPDQGSPSVGLSRMLWTLAVMPGRSGHARSRPWHDTGQWVRNAGGGRRSALERMRQLGSYLLSVLGTLTMVV